MQISPPVVSLQAAKGATVLIHEATFEDALESEALAKRHSLTREAVETGSRAGAYRTLLTHFSQRYPKVPVVADIYCGKTVRGLRWLCDRLSAIKVVRIVSDVPGRRTERACVWFQQSAAGDCV